MKNFMRRDNNIFFNRKISLYYDWFIHNIEMYYTGIGSRETPIQVLKLFEKYGMILSMYGLTLRSGHAPGSDMAFEIGCDIIRGKKEIYLPWKKFGNSNSKLIVHNPSAFDIASRFHPKWNYLSQGAKKLQARNTHQILGWDLKTPTKFVLCWTKGGKETGGTAQAIRLAKYYGIPIFNAGAYNNIYQIENELIIFLRQFINI